MQDYVQPATQELHLEASPEPSEERAGEDIGEFDDEMDDEEHMNFANQPDPDDIYQ